MVNELQQAMIVRIWAEVPTQGTPRFEAADVLDEDGTVAKPGQAGRIFLGDEIERVMARLRAEHGVKEPMKHVWFHVAKLNEVGAARPVEGKGARGVYWRDRAANCGVA